MNKKTTKKKIFKLQPRNDKGRFLTYQGSTKPHYYTEAEIKSIIKSAYMAGLNNQSGLFSHARKIEIYLKSIGI